MKPKIFIANKIPVEVESYLREHCDIRKWSKDTPMTNDQLQESVADVEGLLLAFFPVNEELLCAAPKLKVVSNISVGYNNFDINTMKKRNIMGTNTPYVLDETVADLSIGLMLAAARRMTELDALIRAGKWTKDLDEELFGVDVHHAVLGIVGMGRIGEAVARRASLGFGMEVLYCNRHRKLDAEKRLGVRFMQLDELLQQADFVMVLAALTTETRHLMDFAQFALMKRTAIFINVSRGGTVNEQALIEALHSKQIYGAGLDVYDQEPIEADNPLLKLPNVVLVPHIGSATRQTRFEMAMSAAKGLVEGLSGQVPHNIVPELR